MIDVAEHWVRDRRRRGGPEPARDWLADWAERAASQVRGTIHQHPERAALGALLLGFYLGWRLRGPSTRQATGMGHTTA